MNCWLKLRTHTYFGEGAEIRRGGGETYQKCTRCGNWCHTGTSRPGIGLPPEYYEKRRRDDTERDLRNEIGQLRSRVEQLEEER